MIISTLLAFIDSHHLVLPEFQRGYVWNRKQVRELMSSLYRRYPVGSLLVWVTSSDATIRGGAHAQVRPVRVLLDGQQRITTLYGIMRGKPPIFFEGDASAFEGLRFHLEREEFEFYQPIKMKDDPLWIDLTALMMKSFDGIQEIFSRLASAGIPEKPAYYGRILRILGIASIDLHEDEVAGEDKNIDVVVDIFNRVNSGGTKLSKGDLALAKICAEWPGARNAIRGVIKKWADKGFPFDKDWLLRNINTIVNGEAMFKHLHDIDKETFEAGLRQAERRIDYLLNTISGRLGLDHWRVLKGLYAFPVMTRFLDQSGGQFITMRDRDRLLFWYLVSVMWGRFSASAETTIDRDLEMLASSGNDVNALIGELRSWRGILRATPDNFDSWSVGARFYPILYMLTRVGEALDWDTGLPLKSGLLGSMNKLEVHHIFPKACIKNSYSRPEINAVANFCLLTKQTNLRISARLPAEYLEEIENKHPGALASQWIPMDRSLWRLDRYPDFLAARRELLAEATNRILAELLHADEPFEPASKPMPAVPLAPGGIDSEEEEVILGDLRRWMQERGLPDGEMQYDLADRSTGEAIAVLDLAWPDGVQPGLTGPVAVLIDEDASTRAAAAVQGFRVFVDAEGFKKYVKNNILGHGEA